MMHEPKKDTTPLLTDNELILEQLVMHDGLLEVFEIEVEFAKENVFD